MGFKQSFTKLRTGIWSMGLLMSSIVTYSQNAYHFDQTIPVQANGKSLTLPWAGGLNSPQFSTMDLNGDGKDDLVIFDRTAAKFFTFLNTGSQYIYNRDYEAFFPSSVDEWVLLRDFNCDGRKDLFTSGPGGIAVFVNTTQPGSTPTWRTFNPGHPLLTWWYGRDSNVQMNATDIPAIDDIDEDGDLDVIVAQFSNTYGSMEYHRNMSIENTGRCDSMQLAWVTSMWGNFQECNCGWYDFEDKDCSQPQGGRAQHDAGKSLLTLDLNNDGLRDLLFSEQTCNSLYLMINQGTRDTALIKSFVIYPQAHPTTLLFPASFFEDVDFDGVKDLIISTNISARVTTDIDLSNSVWFYKNSGTSASPQFNFQKPNLLQDQMIDAGSYSSPAFADFDNDGDLDMFISYWAVPDSMASIYQYENTGTFSDPSFKFITNDYLGLSTLGLYNIKIQFEDYNKDGKTDLTFTATDKSTSVTQLYWLKNAGTGGFDFSNQAPESLSFTLDPLENVLLYDVNQDGLDDILCGRDDGSLQYYKNLGGIFVPLDLTYLGLNSDITRFCVSPTVSDLQHDGKPDLVLGNHGSVVIYHDFLSGNNPEADSVLIENQLQNSYTTQSLSSYLTLTTADLYATGSPLIVAGTITGGLHILKADSMATTNVAENSVWIWPNPVDQNSNLKIRVTQNSVVQLFTVLGQKLNDPIAIPAGETSQLLIGLSPGFYFAKVSWTGKSQTMKLIVK